MEAEEIMRFLLHGISQPKSIFWNFYESVKVGLCGDAIILIFISRLEELFGINAMGKVLFLIVKLQPQTAMLVRVFSGICGMG